MSVRLVRLCPDKGHWMGTPVLFLAAEYGIKIYYMYRVVTVSSCGGVIN